jgi:hypothetical protein
MKEYLEQVIEEVKKERRKPTNSQQANFKVSLASLISALSRSMGQEDLFCCLVSARPKSFQSS